MNVETASSATSYSLQAPRWQRALGIRPDEVRTVGLFFLHNFLLGIGTILIYVAANAILLENQPETSLPLAYIFSAMGMILVGRLYAHYEHHLLLSNLAIRVLLAVTVLTVVVGVLVVVGHSVAAAVAIMVGYRIIYLLANLEFWGVSAVVFDTRQSKRLFSVISSGDMPAKALGAVLAALVHAHEEVLRLLIVALGAFLASLYVLRLTILSHDVEAVHRPARSVQREPMPLIGNRFGGSELVFFMCLSMAVLTTVATEIEYSFFVNVKHRFHDQTDVIQYVSIVLAITYGVAMIVKLLLSRQALDRFGIQRSLLVLPWVALTGLIGLSILNAVLPDETSLLIYFCGLYLVFEVIRRALFDPVFLVLFQPLSAPQRLQGHTLVKGLYEPIGLGVAGFLIFGLHGRPALEALAPLVWAILLGVGVWLLGRTYRRYLQELNDAIGRRFLERDQLAMPKTAQTSIIAQLQSSDPAKVVGAIGWLRNQNPNALLEHATPLLQHADTTVRRRMLDALADLSLPVPVKPVTHIALTDTEPELRQQAAYLLGRRVSASASEIGPLLHHSDLAIRQGTIRGILELNPRDAAARQELSNLLTDADPTRQPMALQLIAQLRLNDFATAVKQRLKSPDVALRKQAFNTAGQLTDSDLRGQLLNALLDATSGRLAMQALKAHPSGTVPELRRLMQTQSDRLLHERVTSIAGSVRTPENRELLNELAQKPDRHVRGAALRGLRRFPNISDDDALFHKLLTDELALAHRLLHGSLTTPELTKTLDYELSVLMQRLFDILTQLYDSDTIAHARAGVNHPARERRANALEILDNLIPRSAYQTLQVLIDDLPRAEKVRILDAELGLFRQPETIQAFILENGEMYFTAWTVHRALRMLSSADADIARQKINSAASTPSPLLMNQSTHASQISEYDRVLLLANTSLFTFTPENVLASITPIMREEQHPAGTVLFNKGDLGTALYVIDKGEVSIRDGNTELTRFGRGDFFGELALLDAETRSATAVALTDLRLLRLEQDDFYDLMEERGEVLRSIIRSLSARIRRQNDVMAGRATVAST
ncbi:cyclic nucleotide-binding domain-containing protein [Spirosoma montaniterrae]|uniref:Crp/Fnr family transcriptional regulator n=1 Tax=Spirosoma montaniterrae TaxID=1178516 RepID=A0A1P9X4M3_9BACT|nr:cyclic nucleotide-binding domain-containing protein [Spirosoma montaniterrae]AQG82548.1 Crp/Fnr family transcriptional regulator [Spirosoma montaniterrae]